MDPTKMSYDLVIPAALPAARPLTFVAPLPTKAMLAERKAEAEADALAKKRITQVPLAIRFLRLLESRSVQHNMTTPTVFHSVLKRRRSIPNKHFVGYQDVLPHLEIKIRPEMVGNNAEVHLHVLWKPAFFSAAFVQNDMDAAWSAEVTEVVEPPRKERTAGEDEEEEESSESSDDEETAAVKLRGPGLPVADLVAQTRARFAEEQAEAQAEAAARGALPPPPANPYLDVALRDGASLRLIVPRADLQFRGAVHAVTYRAVHRPSKRVVEATTVLRVSPKGEVWRVALDEFEPFVETESESSESSSEEEAAEEEAPPDPFGDVNEAEKEDPFAKAEALAKKKAAAADAKRKAAQGKVAEAQALALKSAAVVTGGGGALAKGPPRERVPGTPGVLTRGRFENDETWTERAVAEVDAATEVRRTRVKANKEAAAWKLRMTEETKSVFDADARQVSGFTSQFLVQDVADEMLARSKLENKWNGPAQVQGSSKRGRRRSERSRGGELAFLGEEPSARLLQVLCARSSTPSRLHRCGAPCPYPHSFAGRPR